MARVDGHEHGHSDADQAEHTAVKNRIELVADAFVMSCAAETDGVDHHPDECDAEEAEGKDVDNLVEGVVLV